MRTDFYSFFTQGQSFRVHRLLPSTHAHGESDEKKGQAGVNKYRAQKIASNTHACGDGGRIGDALIQTDRHRLLPSTHAFWRKSVNGKSVCLCAKFYPSSYSSFRVIVFT
ncbi:hypothetical protein AVEN_150772-1 [Araneus ventricosus]|uniref:Uncharacterized protein n=1 Tax=Araneus ventricosus TaxID=182803 RepID=A0A4Y2TZW1_ARAVE|nr:hypothetical protein AVEN_150772-1 [Araneus ventricosus]